MAHRGLRELSLLAFGGLTLGLGCGLRQGAHFLHCLLSLLRITSWLLCPGALRGRLLHLVVSLSLLLLGLPWSSYHSGACRSEG